MLRRRLQQVIDQEHHGLDGVGAAQLREQLNIKARIVGTPGNNITHVALLTGPLGVTQHRHVIGFDEIRTLESLPWCLAHTQFSSRVMQPCILNRK